MTTTVINRQKHLRVNRAAVDALTRFFLRHSARAMDNGSGAWTDVTLTLVGHDEMVRANLDFFGRADTTDVISITYDPMPGESPRPSADIIVNAEMAAEEGTKRPLTRNGLPWGAGGELALYIAHGCDHLPDRDDHSPREKRSMRRRELNWIRKARKQGLMGGLLKENPNPCPS